MPKVQHEGEVAEETAEDKERDGVKPRRMPKGPLDVEIMTKAIDGSEEYYPQRHNEETLPPPSFASQRDSLSCKTVETCH